MDLLAQSQTKELRIQGGAGLTNLCLLMSITGDSHEQPGLGLTGLDVRGAL